MIEAIFHWHSFVELLTAQWSILIDPFITWNSLTDCTKEQISEKKIIAICLTHGHSDHLGDTVRLAQKISCPVVAMVELCWWLEKQWVTNLEPCNVWGTWKGDNRSVKFVRAFHSSSTPDGAYAWLAVGFVFFLGDKTIYHAWDTGLFAEMSSFTKYSFDLAFLPIGDRYTMWVQDALVAAWRIQAKVVVPIHFDTFPSIKADAQWFARELMAQNLAVPKVLKAWQAVVIS